MSATLLDVSDLRTYFHTEEGVVKAVDDLSFRLEQGRTLADVAVTARISLPYLSEVERGCKEVSSEVLAALCEALGIELSDLLLAVVVHLTVETGQPTRAAAPPARRSGDAYALAA
jgi:transcriptional regulator with XRE-family HTH domain